MPRKATTKAKSKNGNGVNLGIENELWEAADKLRGHLDAAEYKSVVLGLIFLKYISDRFEIVRERVEKEGLDDPEDRDVYLADRVFWVPKDARWKILQDNAAKEEIGNLIDKALDAIEKDNPTLKGMLPTNYGRVTLDKRRLGDLVTMVSNKINFADEESRKQDTLGRVYEYFLSQFASQEGRKGGEFYTPREEFLSEVSRMPQKNLAIELLRKLLNDELKSRMKKNVVQSRSFTEMLERTIRSYQNRTLAAAEVITELIKLGGEMREAQKRGEKLNLTEDEIAFYDALEVNDSAVKVLGDDTLKNIARELVETVRNNTTIDWTVREAVRAKLRVMVKRILRKHGYPPDKQEKATQTVLEQAEVIARDWAG